MLLLALAWLALALTLTLVPVPAMDEVARRMSPLCLLCGDRGLADFVLNIGFFMPFGWAVARWRDWRWAVVLGLAVSLGIESLQTWVPGRFATLGDLVANGSGALLGAWFAGREARVLPWAAVGAVMAVLAPLALLAPRPPHGVYYGQWTARFGNMAHYEGRVVHAEVGGIETPSRRSDRSDEVRAALGRDGPVDVTFVVGPPPPALAPLFSVFDDRRRRIFLLGVDGQDLVVWRWTVATTLKLDSPTLRWRGWMTGRSPGDTARIRFARGRRAPCLTLDGRTDCDIGIGAGAGWTLLASPDALTRAGRMALGAGWMLVLGVILGLPPWSPTSRIGTATALALGGLALSAALPYLSVSVVPAIALLLGAGLGASLPRRTTSR